MNVNANIVKGYRYCAQIGEIVTTKSAAEEVESGFCDLDDHLPIYVEDSAWKPPTLCDANRRNKGGKVLAVCGLPINHDGRCDLP